jgi:general secretion pathway protein D
MGKILEPFAADNTVRVDEVRNLVIMAGNQKELRHLVDTVELFDVDWLSGYSVGIFPVKSADVKSLVQDLDKIFGPTAQGPLAGIVRVIPIERLNALLIVTRKPKYLEGRAHLDGAARPDRRHLRGLAPLRLPGAEWQGREPRQPGERALHQAHHHVHHAAEPRARRPSGHARHAHAGHAGQPEPRPRPRPRLPALPAAAAFAIPGSITSTTSEVRVIADKDNNALLILATPTDYEIIESALRKLDVVPKQVLVEVTVAEVTLSDDLKFGVDWFLNGRSVGNASVTDGTLNLGGLPTTPTGAVPLFTGLQLINRKGGDVRAVLNALGKDGRLQVLATPQLMVLDNQKAQIKVGDKISVQTQQQSVAGSTSGLINSFQYIETGILLAVTPRINSGGQVTLEVSQEVSVPQPASVAGANPDISQRDGQHLGRRGFRGFHRARRPHPRGQHARNLGNPAPFQDPRPGGGLRFPDHREAPHRDHPAHPPGRHHQCRPRRRRPRRSCAPACRPWKACCRPRPSRPTGRPHRRSPGFRRWVPGRPSRHRPRRPGVDPGKRVGWPAGLPVSENQG